MGRIKQLMVKRASKELLTKDLVFGEHFTGNKIMLGSNTMPSKKIRNKVAGYIARLRRAEIKVKIAEDKILASKTTMPAETAYS
ncbi:MAG: 30S ribosomal protein S17e [Nanoarchaeota archaeon]